LLREYARNWLLIVESGVVVIVIVPPAFRRKCSSILSSSRLGGGAKNPQDRGAELPKFSLPPPENRKKRPL
jgi:hypothetical protein